ncbi:phosphoglycerate mutase (2,3-diphosphoglycerate-independent) [candidate division WOR-1 bacterium RIFOXYA12_FULL_52_29]|uniref:2,3-bisphosphoglycerate-independent phosphoglycerate mutase n=1 Tax=candidate division WOR-1 bacterium RIFOXYC12_FULL_54_18 TaxID=1802584 RepID=A0A1F4T5V8_UNCSA|nr:MAG: phosphoglycerate mutase (2,3-diphosphoglycerate-independent) [candidate division WOR-1 bacterium RIFOXYA2_FULL_51_19]OGC17758.1 MAG: phosphoglycerate mutase (2,3-diphosphoglycerate-independent) [candidate division WOR-1 bacterium RIFOXYA12_FULL_52_29]OGC26615.1 MAG: phosphoglycerate mutase (2,3-diphosphoglycerate-independent) [candidate division WOR-1 bacterium RIFOXYB2_FULL_45_9]OGC28175.1 MAG: phosphoglycerate mutase (2,3-diphosphoglycerate-independent) [candidate division WOR-1 bacter
MKNTPVYLCILDGFAIGKKSETNAIYHAIEQGKAPFIKELFEKHPYAKLECSGLAVGLPEGTMGNSEVNHLNMGAGRIVYQSIERINVAIEDGSFFANEALLAAARNAKQNGSALHLMGLLQGHSGTVHASIKHLFALLELAKKERLQTVYIHLFTDGRDTNPKAAGEIYLKMLEDKIADLGLTSVVKIATVMGRELAMDRDTSWDKTLLAMKCLIEGRGEHKANTPREAIESSYLRGETDEFIRPTVVSGYTGMGPVDSIVYFNFRQDRTIQLTVGFCESDKKFFNYKKGTKPIDDEVYAQIQALRAKLKQSVFVAMTEYYHGVNALTAFPEKEIPETVGEIVSKAGLTQLRLAGPEKFAHVTGWFSGRRSDPFPGEERHLAQDLTLKERTEGGKHYDWVPEMTAFLETDYALKAIAEKNYSLIVHNFQNGDMVGHTGNLAAATEAIADLSKCLEKLVPAWLAKGGVFIITADHGNADEMKIENKGKEVVSTQHSLNPVPFWALGSAAKLKEKGIIPDIGVTILYLIGLPIPKAMTAHSLVNR